MATLGFIYPGHSGESDYELLGRLLAPDHSVIVEHTPVPIDLHREDALRQTGDAARLAIGAKALKAAAVDSSTWACTSASFVFGLAGAHEQASRVAAITGVPSSSTSLSFVTALEAFGISAVAIAATYPEDVTELLRKFLADAAITTLRTSSLGILGSVEVSRVPEQQALELIESCDHTDAEAILLPDTALPSLEWIEEVERHTGKLVMSANQVTAWQGMRLAGVTAKLNGRGRLLREA